MYLPVLQTLENESIKRITLFFVSSNFQYFIPSQTMLICIDTRKFVNPLGSSDDGFNRLKVCCTFAGI